MLTPFFKEQLDKTWVEFVESEADHQSYSSAQAVVFALIRACASGKLPAIKEALDRVDGKVAMEIEVQYPKFFMLFPYATSVAGVEAGEAASAPGEMLPERPKAPPEPATSSLRDTLTRMIDEPRALVDLILDSAKEIDMVASYGGQEYPNSNPKVRSVIAAGLLKMAHGGRLGAVFEVFDQIDGKVADKIRLLGDDVYLTRYDLVAPAGAVKNEDGIYQISADNTTNRWAAALERQQRGRN